MGKRYCSCRTIILFLLILFAGFPCLTFAQSTISAISAKYEISYSSADSALVKQLQKNSIKQYYKANYDGSITDYKSLSKIFSKYRDYGNLAVNQAHIANIYAIKGNLKEAFVYVSRVKKLIKTRGTHFRPSKLSMVNDYLGRIYQIKEDGKQTLAYYKKSLQIFQDYHVKDLKALSHLFNDIGSYYYDQGDYKTALDYLQQGLHLAYAVLPHQSDVISDFYNNLGIVNSSRGNYKKALKFYKKDLRISLVILGKDHPDLAVTYNNIGGIYFRLGDYDNALDYYNKALRIILKRFGPEHLKTGMVYNNIGAIYYYKKNYDKSIEYFRRSLNIKRHALGDVNNNVAIAYLNIGSIYEETKDYDDALAYNMKALRIKLKLFGPDNPRIASTYDEIGDIYREQKKYSRAIAYLAKELRIYIKTLGFNYPYTATTFINIGEVYQDQKNYDEALDFYQRALMSLVPQFHNENLDYNPALSDIRSKKSLLMALKHKANALYLRFNVNKDNLNDLKLSVKTYDLIIRLINKMRESYKAKGSKLLLGEQSYKIYERGIRSALELYDQTKDPAYKEKAFAFSESSKSNVLLESIVDSKAKKFAGIPNSLLVKEKKLKENLVYFNNQLQEELSKKNKSDSVKISYWQDKLFSGNRAYHAFIHRLEKEYPKYYHLKYDIPKISIDHLQQSLVDKNTAIVSYFKGDTTLYIFTITHNQFKVYKQKISKHFKKDIIAVRKGITDKDYSKYAQNAYKLYKILIEPEKKQISDKRLIIIPEGVLGYLPFETLLTEKPPVEKNPDYSVYRHLNYLIFKHTISYAYSIPLLEELQSRSTVYDSHQFLGMAPVFDKKHNSTTNHYAVRGDSLNNLSPLYASAHEVKDIYNLFEKNRGFFSWLPFNESTIYLRNHATESVLKSPEASEFKYIHLATHAFIDEQNPNMSGIILARNPSSGDDGVLYASEIYNLNLNARLVVLSACETAMGKFVKGEGIMGLARSFIYAGANNLVVSLWNVSDRSTAQLMIHFYSKLLKKQKIYSSLCDAKREMIRNTQFSAPIYWSPFILIGNN